MAKLIGNIDEYLNCTQLVKDCVGGFREYQTFRDKDGNIDRVSQLLVNDPKADERLVKVIKANYPGPMCDGLIYTGAHFPEKYIRLLDEYLGTVCVRVVVSEFDPGKVTVPHYDWAREKDKKAEAKLLEYGDIEGYHVHLGEPEEGHGFMIEGECCYMQAQGNIWKWDNYLSWHSAVNTGWNPKRILSYFGLRLKKDLPNYTYKYNDKSEGVELVLDDGTIL